MYLEKSTDLYFKTERVKTGETKYYWVPYLYSASSWCGGHLSKHLLLLISQKNINFLRLVKT